MFRLDRPHRPHPWPERRTHHAHRPWALPFARFEWCLEWIAFALGNWALVEVLEYLGTFSLLIAVIFYFAESGNRTRQRHYAAWSVINIAQGKGGSGGRIEALEELNHDHVPLIGLDASLAFLQRVQLPNALLSRCSFQAADLRMGSFRKADLSFCNLRAANLRNADLERAQLADAVLADADLNGANLRSAELKRADLTNVDLRNADLTNLHWQEISSLRLANLYGAKNAPEGFLSFALAHGAVSIESDDHWTALQNATAPTTQH
jgi:uncharacterized protein YjbI with pentapeptide repeats